MPETTSTDLDPTALLDLDTLGLTAVGQLLTLGACAVRWVCCALRALAPACCGLVGRCASCAEDGQVVGAVPGGSWAVCHSRSHWRRQGHRSGRCAVVRRT